MATAACSPRNRAQQPSRRLVAAPTTGARLQEIAACLVPPERCTQCSLAECPGSALVLLAALDRMVYAARLTAEGSVLGAGHDGHVRLLEQTPQPARGSCRALRPAWQLAPSLADPGWG